jgi:HlyD family secretion protein
MKTLTLISITAILLWSCKSGKNEHDASGTFEAVETIVSSEASGTIKALHIEEGQTLQNGEVIGYIDSTQLYLKKKQLVAQINAVLSKKPNISAQLAALQAQLKQAEHEQQRLSNLLKSEAVTQKQMDDVNAQVDIIKKQIDAQQSSLDILTTGINEETLPVQAQIEQLNDQLNKCKITNPVNGTVLTKYAETNEMTTNGKALYKIADLSSIVLRAYITSDQLSTIKLNQTLKVLVDAIDGNRKEYTGQIEWISSKAEFTPKTIQTKDERANLVYAVKIKIKNDGYLKIGMYADVKF